MTQTNSSRANNTIRQTTRVALFYDQSLIREFEKLNGIGINKAETFDLNLNGFINIILTAYYDEPWLLQEFEKGLGCRNKAAKCYEAGQGKVTAMIFTILDENIDLVAEKEKLRNISKVDGKHSLHISDGYYDTSRLVHTLFDRNSSTYYLNNFDFASNINIIKELMKLEYDDPVVITGSLILSLAAGYKFKDIDVITIDSLKNDFDCHNVYDDYLEHYDETKFDNLLFKSDNFFFINWHFLSIERLIAFKERRNESKDIIHVELLKQMLNTKNTYDESRNNI